MVSDFKLYGADADKWREAGMSESDEEHLVLALWRFFRGRTEIPVAELPASIRFLYIATRDRWAAQRPSSYSREERRANGRKGGLATQARNRTAQAHAQGHPSAPAQAPTSTTTATATAAAPTKTSHFIPPTEDEVRAYCAEKKYAIDAEAFVAYYTSNGWKIGRASMKSWKAALVTWNKRNKDCKNGTTGNYRGQNRSNFYSEGIGANAGI